MGELMLFEAGWALGSADGFLCCRYTGAKFFPELNVLNTSFSFTSVKKIISQFPLSKRMTETVNSFKYKYSSNRLL